MTRNFWKIASVSLAALGLATGCQPAANTETAESVTSAAPAGPDYASLVAAPGRTAEDTAKDVNRKPAEVLAFSKIAPGQSVFEMEAGAGYYLSLIHI